MPSGEISAEFEVERLSPEQQAAARRTICRNAIGDTDSERRADASRLLAMLGLLHPVPDQANSRSDSTGGAR